MANLTLTRSGTNRIFLPDGKVAIADVNGNPTIKGSWNSKPDRSSNRLAYTFDGAEEEVDIQYEINDSNQLVAFFPGSANEGTDSDKVTFQGRIFIDDNQDLAYSLFDDAGVAMGRTLTVHGELALSELLDELTVTLAGGGGTIAILGDRSGANNLEPGTNELDSVHRDNVRFKATTNNTFNGIERDDDAIVLFVGNWDLNQN